MGIVLCERGGHYVDSDVHEIALWELDGTVVCEVHATDEELDGVPETDFGNLPTTERGA